jgi:hypothetical protein
MRGRAVAFARAGLLSCFALPEASPFSTAAHREGMLGIATRLSAYEQSVVRLVIRSVAGFTQKLRRESRSTHLSLRHQRVVIGASGSQERVFRKPLFGRSKLASSSQMHMMGSRPIPGFSRRAPGLGVAIDNPGPAMFQVGDQTSRAVMVSSSWECSPSCQPQRAAAAVTTRVWTVGVAVVPRCHC